jgi:hypothetical protein
MRRHYTLPSWDSYVRVGIPFPRLFPLNILTHRGYTLVEETLAANPRGEHYGNRRHN